MALHVAGSVKTSSVQLVGPKMRSAITSHHIERHTDPIVTVSGGFLFTSPTRP